MRPLRRSGGPSRRQVLLAGAAPLFAGSRAAAQSRYALAPASNPAFRPSQVFFRFEDIASPPFVELRRRFPLAATVAGADEEFTRILLLRNWIFRTLRVDMSRPNPPADAISILAQGPSGGPFECSHAMIAQNAVMNAMGYLTRCLQPGPGGPENTYLAAGNHGVNEIWSNRHAKWFISDAEFDGHFEKAGVPLSALEIRDEFLKDGAKAVDLVVGPGRAKTAPRLLFSPHCYRFVSWELAGDRHTNSGWGSGSLVVWEDEYFKTHPWRRWANSSDNGQAPLHWAFKNNAFVRVAQREWIEWTPNVVAVTAALSGTAARVRLRSHTPWFARYEMRAGSWQQAEAAFDLPLEGARVEREFRAVNTVGVSGPVSRVLIERR